MNAPLYTTDILRLAASLPEPVELGRVDGSASQRSPTCGSTVRADVKINDRGRIQAASLRVQACAFGQASGALVAGGAAGRDCDEVRAVLEQLTAWLSGQRADPPDWPGFEALTPARVRKSRHGAILLPLRALLAAIETTKRG
jgi:NifU-like protein involved in Fe-S cluster formation